MSKEQASSIVETPPAYRDVTWEKAAGQREIFVSLHHFPAQLKFDDNFPEPIRYDAVKERLCYRGLMYHGSYSYLRNQSTEANYLIAIDQLYQLSSSPPKQSHIGAWVSAITAGIAIVGVVSAWRWTH